MQLEILDNWKRAFEIDDGILHRWVHVYPEIVDDDRNNKSLSADEMVKMFVAQPVRVDTAEEAFAYYLQEGELAASRSSLRFFEVEETGQHIEEEMAQSKNKWEERYHNILSDVESMSVELVHLGINKPAVVQGVQIRVKTSLWIQNGRPGKAVQYLGNIYEQLNREMHQQVEQVQSWLLLLEENLPKEMEEDYPTLECRRHLRLARDYLDMGEVVLARHEANQASNALESSVSYSNLSVPVDKTGSIKRRWTDLSSIVPSRPIISNEGEGIYYHDPGEFPGEVSLDHVIRWMKDGVLPSYQQPRGWSDFLTGWAVTELRTGEVDENLDDGDNHQAVLKTLKHLKKAQGMSRKETWPAFFRQFLRSMDLNTNAAPQNFKGISNTRGLLHERLGGRAGTRLSIQGSFINISCFPRGIDLIIWPDPRDYKPITARPAMRESRLDDKVGFIFTPVRVPKQIMNEFNKNFPGWAVFDEAHILKVLLASSPDERLTRFIVEAARQINPESINPYSTQGPVQHEAMFFGRKQELFRLMNPNGPAIVYGGRKLGKSSLLSQIVPRFESQTDGKHVALYLAIPQAGDTQGSVGEALSSILRHLAFPIDERNWIVNHRNPKIRVRNGEGFNNYLNPDKDPQDFFNQMYELLNKFQEHHFLFLLDEADAFLESQVDSARRSQLHEWEQTIGWKLRALRDTSGGRVDFIFAGFQGIARAARDPGGPFVNFRGTDPLPLSVLSEEEARELVARPLQYLGLRFERRSLIERILYYTGRHPALLQQFCSELYLMKPEKGIITSRHIENVFIDKDFRKKIFAVINFNLSPIGLDRPKIILSLIMYLWIRYSYRSGNLAGNIGHEDMILHRETVTAKDIYKRLLNHFQGHKVDRVLPFDEVESYLEDLRVLGVVEQGQHGFYIANRYFAQILMSEHNLDQEIEKLWEQLNQISRTVERRSIQLQSGERGLLPITPEDENRLTNNTKLCMLFGSRGVGKSLLLGWLEERMSGTIASSERKIIRIDCQDMTDIDDLCNELGRQLGHAKAGWEELRVSINASSNQYYLCFEDVDQMVDLELMLSEKFAEFRRFLGSAIQDGKSSASCRFNILISGGMELARFWVEWMEELEGVALPVCVKRYSELDEEKWMKINSLYPSEAGLIQYIWRQCQGDFRILNAFLSYLKDREGRSVLGDFELTHEHFDHFTRELLLPNEDAWKEEVQANVHGLNMKALSVLEWLVYCQQQYGEREVSVELLQLFIEEFGQPQGWHWSFRDLVTEVKALAIIDEIETSIDQKDNVLGRNRENDLWLRFVLQSQALVEP